MGDSEWAPIAGRIIAVFGVVGLSLGLAVAMFIASAQAPGGQQGEIQALVAAEVALTGTLVFALMIGVVMAALGGALATGAASSRRDAILAAVAAGAIGHLVLVSALIIVGMVGIEVVGSPTVRRFASTALNLDTIARLGLGLFPAGVSGGLAAALLWARQD